MPQTGLLLGRQSSAPFILYRMPKYSKAFEYLQFILFNLFNLFDLFDLFDLFVSIPRLPSHHHRGPWRANPPPQESKSWTHQEQNATNTADKSNKSNIEQHVTVVFRISFIWRVHLERCHEHEHSTPGMSLPGNGFKILQACHTCLFAISHHPPLQRKSCLQCLTYAPCITLSSPTTVPP